MHMLSVSAVLALAVTASAQSNISAQDATTFALTYGYPLLAYEKVRIAAAVVGPNKWLHFRALQGPLNKNVVKPNVDTLYSALVYDLSHDDLLVSLPADSPDSQFELISFFDPYGTNYVNIGTMNTNTAGTYRLAPRTVSATPQISSGNTTDVVETLETTSLYGFVLIRWLVNNTNLEAIEHWQNETVNATIPAATRGPALASLPTFNNSKTPVDNVLQLLTAFAPYTLPNDVSLAQNVTATLAVAGINNGSYTAQQGVDLNLANQTAVANAVAAAAAPTAKSTLNNGWTVANASLIGIYGDNFAFRTAVASAGYLAIKAPNAIYPSWSNGSSATPLGGDFILGPDEAILLTFTSKPPLTSTGFWSVTAYQNNYLIDNPYNIYAVTSERSNITYADGTLVYGNSSQSGQFQILVQPGDVAPPSNWTSNFLPGPPGGGAVALTLRLYDAEQTLLDGNYEYPIVTRITALTGGALPNGTTTSPPSSTSSMPVRQTGAAAHAVTSSGLLLSALACLSWLL